MLKFGTAIRTSTYRLPRLTITNPSNVNHTHHSSPSRHITHTRLLVILQTTPRHYFSASDAARRAANLGPFDGTCVLRKSIRAGSEGLSLGHRI